MRTRFNAVALFLALAAPMAAPLAAQARPDTQQRVATGQRPEADVFLATLNAISSTSLTEHTDSALWEAGIQGMIDALQDTHESWLSHKTNEVIRVLTIFSVTMLPLTFITGLYGMNVLLPFGHHPFAFLGVVVCLLIIVTGMMGFFIKKKWL